MVTTTVEHVTKTYDGKEYPFTITKQRGIQEIEVRGERIMVESVTIMESSQGRQCSWTRVRREASAEEREANRRNLEAVIAQAFIDQHL